MLQSPEDIPWFPLFPPSGSDKEETGRTDKRTRGFVQLCGEQQAHLHRKGETEGRDAVTLEVKARINRGGVHKRSFPFGDAQMLNRLTKSAEAQARLDEDYFKINMEGHQMRLKLENTLKNCHQVGKGSLAASHCSFESELISFFRREGSFTCTTSPVTKKSQSTSLQRSVHRDMYGLQLHMFHSLVSRSSWSWRSSGWKCCVTFWRDTTFRCPASVKHWTMWERLKARPHRRDSLGTRVDNNAFHSCTLQGHRQIEQAIQKVDMDGDVQVLVQENSIITDDNKAEFLMTDYFVSMFQSMTSKFYTVWVLGCWRVFPTSQIHQLI